MGSITGAVEGGLGSAVVLGRRIRGGRGNFLVWVFVYVCFTSGERTEGCGFHE